MAGSQTTFTELIKTENKNKPTPKMKNKNYMYLIQYSRIIDDILKDLGRYDVDSFREAKKSISMACANLPICSNLLGFHPSERSTHSTSCFQFQFLSMSLQ